MAAPPLQSSYIKVQTFTPDSDQCGALVLHLQPRPQAAGLEIAAYTGDVSMCCDVADRMTVDDQSELPATADALAAFAASMIETGPPHWLNSEGEISALGLRLPSQPPNSGSSGWSSASVELHGPGDVEHGESLLYDTDGRLVRRSKGLTFQNIYEVSDTPVYQEVRNASERTAPDPPETFGQRWREARDRAADKLAAAMTAVLQRAVSYRGDIPPPSAQQSVPRVA